MNPNQNDYLEHFGVKGMHWGIRKKRETSGRIPSTSKNTKSSSVRGKATLKMHGKPKKGMMDFDIFDSNGKKVGDLSMDHVSDSEVYFNWFSIRGKKNQGQGYAQAAMKQAIAEAKKMGYKKMTAECVGSNGGRALHIAEKYGAKVVGPTTKNSVWGSMTPVEWDLTRELKHSDDYLEHFGVKGMKWGVRKKETGGKVTFSSTGKRGEISGEIRNSIGKKIGTIKLQKDPYKNEMYIWNMSIRASERGKSYGQQTLKDAILKAKSDGCASIYSEISSKNQAFLTAAKRAGFTVKKISNPRDVVSYYRAEYKIDDMKHSDDYLEHYGVKGMKWGVRKAKDTVSRLRAKRESKYSDDYRRYKSAKRRKTSELSNAELKDLINRGNLEQQYRNLKKQDISAGRKFVQDVLYKSATSTASGIVTKKMREGVEYAGSKVTSYRYLKSKGMV